VSKAAAHDGRKNIFDFSNTPSITVISLALGLRVSYLPLNSVNLTVKRRTCEECGLKISKYCNRILSHCPPSQGELLAPITDL
jgi:hypothetical protein